MPVSPYFSGAPMIPQAVHRGDLRKLDVVKTDSDPQSHRTRYFGCFVPAVLGSTPMTVRVPKRSPMVTFMRAIGYCPSVVLSPIGAVIGFAAP